MTDSERIRELKKFTGLNFSKLAEEIGLNTVQTLYDIKNGKCGISKEVAKKIQERYLNISIAWLLTGEGEMLVDNQVIQNNQNGDNIHGHSVTVNNTEKDYLEIIKTQADQLSKSQDQIDRLISIIETMTNNK